MEKRHPPEKRTHKDGQTKTYVLYTMLLNTKYILDIQDSRKDKK